MSNANTPREDAELEAFLGRKSIVTEAYAAIEPVTPPDVLDGKVLALARSALTAAAAKAPAKPVAAAAETAKPAVAAGTDKPPLPRPTAPSAPRSAPPAARVEDDDPDDAPPARRPGWLVPAALAASVLVAVGVGVTMLGSGSSSEPDADSANPLGAMFAKRARDRSEADKAAAETAADQAAPVVELAPLPPPPVFEPEGPQIEDLDTAIALIRRELVLANQMAVVPEEARAAGLAGSAGTAPASAPPAGAATLVAPPRAEAPATAGVVQPRDRRLTKIIELYDGGNPDLAAASLEIFLRDFEGDPVSQRILDAQPKDTDVAVE